MREERFQKSKNMGSWTVVSDLAQATQQVALTSHPRSSSASVVPGHQGPTSPLKVFMETEQIHFNTNERPCVPDLSWKTWSSQNWCLWGERGREMRPFLMHDKGNAGECSQCWPEVRGSYFPICKPLWNNPGLSFLKKPRLLGQLSPPGSAGVVEKWYWQALPCMHVQRLGVYLNTAAAACWSWSCLCLAIRILEFFFFFW